MTDIVMALVMAVPFFIGYLVVDLTCRSDSRVRCAVKKLQSLLTIGKNAAQYTTETERFRNRPLQGL